MSSRREVLVRRRFIIAALLLAGLAMVVGPAATANTVNAQVGPTRVAICHPSGPGEARPSVARFNLDGSWSGLFMQPPFNPYPIAVEFQNSCGPPGSVIASVDYPSVPCSGTWTLESAVGTRLVVLERIVTGTRCISDCRWGLTYDPVKDKINLVGLPSALCTDGGDPTTFSAVLSRTPDLVRRAPNHSGLGSYGSGGSAPGEAQNSIQATSIGTDVNPINGPGTRAGGRTTSFLISRPTPTSTTSPESPHLPDFATTSRST